MRLDRLAMKAVKTAGLPLAPWMAAVKATRRATHAGEWRRRQAAVDALADPAWRGHVPADKGFRRFDAAELPHLADAVAACARIADTRLGGAGGGIKPFFHNILRGDDLTAEPALLAAALSPPMLAIAADYVRCLPRLKAIGLYHSPVNDSTTSSQLFHLDNDDLRQLKCFVNVWPVDDAAGPFTLLPADATARTRTRLGARARYARGKLTDGQVLGGGESAIELKGPPGTAAFVDTSRCLHFGSRARGAARLVFMFQFTSWPDAAIGKDAATEGQPLMQFPPADDPLRAMVLGQA
jgi:hypothetical protein